MSTQAPLVGDREQAEIVVEIGAIKLVPPSARGSVVAAPRSAPKSLDEYLKGRA